MVKGKGGYIYIFGGTAGLYFHNDLFRFHPKDYVFEQIRCNEYVPTPR